MSESQIEEGWVETSGQEQEQVAKEAQEAQEEAQEASPAAQEASPAAPQVHSLHDCLNDPVEIANRLAACSSEEEMRSYYTTADSNGKMPGDIALDNKNEPALECLQYFALDDVTQVDAKVKHFHDRKATLQEKYATAVKANEDAQAAQKKSSADTIADLQRRIREEQELEKAKLQSLADEKTKLDEQQARDMEVCQKMVQANEKARVFFITRVSSSPSKMYPSDIVTLFKMFKLEVDEEVLRRQLTSGEDLLSLHQDEKDVKTFFAPEFGLRRRILQLVAALVENKGLGSIPVPLDEPKEGEPVWPSPRPPCERWNCTQTLDYLVQEVSELKEVEEKLKTFGITGAVLLSLSEEDVDGFDLPSFPMKRKMLKAVAALNKA